MAIILQVLDKTLLVQLLATIVTYYALRLVLFLRVRHKRFQLLRQYGIPGPKPRLLDGSLRDFTKFNRSHEWDLKLREQYGDTYGVYYGDCAEVVTVDPEKLREIFFERAGSFKERAVVFLKNPITKSILFAGFNRWKVMRKIMAAPFSAYSMRGRESMEFIEDTIRSMLAYIDQRLSLETKDEEPGVDLDVLDVMKATALSMISAMAIQLPGVEVRENEPNVASLDYFLSNVTEGAYQLAICFPFLRGLLEFLAERFDYSKTLGDIRRNLAVTIDAGLEDLKRANGSDLSQRATKRPQLIEALIRLHHEGRITRDEVVCNCEAILIAGYDTTSTTLAYIFWTLGKHPKVQERLRAELMAHGTESGYLEQVINEVMRLYPTVLNFITRLATETVRVGDLTIPSGTVVSYRTWLMHRDPKLWPEPEKFDPERFREGVDIHPCAFAPFGLGERKCLGFQLAILELKMITCDVLMRYRLITKAPARLELKTHSMVLSKPTEKVIVNLQRL